MIKIDEVRNEIPYLRKRIYFDCASVCPPFKCVIDEMVKFYEDYPYNYGVGDVEEAKKATEKVEEARRKIGQMINVKQPEEIILSPKNTTEALNMVIGGLEWENGDEIIQFNLDHKSSFIPILRVGKLHGVKIKTLMSDEYGVYNPKDVANNISKRTKLVSVCHVSNLYGTIQDVREICRIAEDFGALTLVDAAQSVGRMPVDVKEIGCTFMAFPGRKHLCGPQGTGVLYGQYDELRKLEPLITGIRSAQEIGYEDYNLSEPPKRHEAGVIDTAGVIGLGKAVEYLMEVGLDNVKRKIDELTKHFVTGLKEMKGVRVLGPTNMKLQAGIVSFISKEEPRKLSQRMDKDHNIIVKAASPGTPGSKELHDKGISMVNRASFHCFNTIEEIDIFRSAMK